MATFRLARHPKRMDGRAAGMSRRTGHTTAEAPIAGPVWRGMTGLRHIR